MNSKQQKQANSECFEHFVSKSIQPLSIVSLHAPAPNVTRVVIKPNFIRWEQPRSINSPLSPPVHKENKFIMESGVTTKRDTKELVLEKPRFQKPRPQNNYQLKFQFK
jgi:hypothetical protein